MGFEEADDAVAEALVLGMGGSLVAVARAGDGDFEIEADGGFRAIGHEDDAVTEVEGFVDIVGDHDDGFAVLFPEIEDEVLEFEAGEGVEHAEGFVEEEEARLLGEGAGDGDALLGALGEGGGEFAGKFSDAGRGDGIRWPPLPLQ